MTLSTIALAIIGWSGAIPILLVFNRLLRKKLRPNARILLFFFIYLVSLATGIYFHDEIELFGMSSAFVAGIIAPICYSSMAYLILRKRQEIEQEDSEDILDD